MPPRPASRSSLRGVAVADRQHAAGRDLERREFRVALGQPGVEVGAPDLVGLVGMEEGGEPALGDLRGHLHVLGPQAGHEDRDALTNGMIDDLEGLAQTRPLVLGQRDLVGAAVVFDPVASPYLAADVDDLPGPGQRLVEGHAVPSFDHLGAGGADAEHEASARNGVEAGGGHRRQVGVREYRGRIPDASSTRSVCPAR